MSSQKYVPRKEWRWGQRDEVVPEDYYHTDFYSQTDLHISSIPLTNNPVILSQ